MKETLEAGAACATIPGVPGAISAYLRAKTLEGEQQEKEREEREYGTYVALDN